MQVQIERFFNLTASLSDSLGPVTRLMDTVIERLLPEQEAKACDTYNCGGYCGLTCAGGGGARQYWVFQVTSSSGCSGPTNRCYVGCIC